MQEVTDQRSYCLRLRKIQQLKEESVVNYISLSSARPTVVGRVITDDVNTKMLSKVTPLMVSRRHASLTIENGKVFVIDHSVSFFCLPVPIVTIIALHYHFICGDC